MPRSAPRTNLPVERGSFVGRVKLLDEIARGIDGGARLITLAGPEGIGKTRLALRAAALELPRFGARGGVWFVDAVEVTGAAGLVRDLLLVQGLLPEAGADVDVELKRAVQAFSDAGPALVVIDGLDRPGTSSLLVQLLVQAPELRVIVTARGPLDVGDEKVVKVGPLKLAKQSQQDARTISTAEAVQLFVERAAEVKRGYTPGAAEVHAIAQIVRQLDGVPLAIEIAAARLRALTAPELLERLPRKVALLAVAGGARGSGSGASQRAALAGAVAWSLDLLPPWEQSALAQAAVFRGGFDSDAAAAVIDLSPFADAPTVPQAIESLLEKALLRVQDLPASRTVDDADDVARRLDMPGVVRELIDARLGHDVARDALSNRHASHYLSVCSAWAEGADGHGGLTLRRRLELESDNLTAAVRRALMADPQTLASITTALRGVLALEPVLTTKGPHELFLELLDRSLEPAEFVGVTHALRARALEARGRARRARHQMALSLTDLEAAHSCAKKARDRLLEARALANIGTHYLAVGKYDRAEATYKDALLLLDEVGERKIYARALGFSALLDHMRGDPKAAVKRYQEALLVHRDCGDRRWEGIHEGQLGSALLEAGDIDSARAHLRRSIAIHRELHNRRFEAVAISWLGDAAVAAGEFDEARTMWERALGGFRQVGDPRGEALTLARLGAMAVRKNLNTVAEELISRARELVVRLDDKALVDALAIFQRKAPADPAPPASSAPPEVARAAAAIMKALS